jgi:hypothetical protein
MHSKNPLVLSEVRLVRFSAVGDGMHIELTEPGSSGALLTFREDDQLGFQVVVHLVAKDVAFPLSELKRAIGLAEADVHTESFYDKETPPA